jgi:transcriptional regulator with XRE-family HTH domain
MRERALRARLGRALRQARASRSLTQRVLATKAGVGEKYLSRIERGLATPSVLVALRLARALGVGLDQLVAAPRQEAAPRSDPGTLGAAIVRLLGERSPADLERAERVLRALFR